MPFFLHPLDGSGLVGLAIAGVSEYWTGPFLPPDHPQHMLCTMTVLTPAASDLLGLELVLVCGAIV